MIQSDPWQHLPTVLLCVPFNYLPWKSVKLIQLVIVQHCVLTMVAGHYNCKVAVLEITDGCPIYPGSIFNQTFNMKPLAQVCKQERGLALDGMLSKEIDETNLGTIHILRKHIFVLFGPTPLLCKHVLCTENKQKLLTFNPLPPPLQVLT